MDDYTMDLMLRKMVLPEEAKAEMFTINREMYQALQEGNSSQLEKIFNKYLSNEVQSIPAVYSAIVRKYLLPQTQ